MSISVIFKGLEGLNKFGKFLNSTLPDIFSVAEMGFTSINNNPITKKISLPFCIVLLYNN